LIEAEKFNASHALTLIHSFSQTDEGFDDFEQFVALFGAKVEVDSIVHTPRRVRCGQDSTKQTYISAG